MTIIPLVTTSLITAWAIGHESLLRTWSLQTWIMVSVMLTITSSVALTPPTFLALVYGYFLGWIAMPLLFGLNLGAIALIYITANFFHAASVRDSLVRIYPQVSGLLRRFYQNELRVIFFAKLSPVLPFTITNLFFAVAGARLKQVLVGGMLGMVPRTVLAVWAGREARDIRYLLEHPNEGLWTKVILILLIAVSTLGMGYLFKDRRPA
ncbi:VTT domain-containing protein [Dyadobacter sandarakinus]|uniref:TVP38/TMEM64 family membrane protein n=1 Tax=Dyadobacter sandarakinus TaxID=2747268 RepID=A0ABX7IDM3_9BACT|nr:VTT domain-containing protein [Dyadobacter sandarakinus]